MCEFLIMAANNNNSDSGINVSGCWKRGDIVAVKEDNHAWGTLEGPPIFEIIKLPGTPLASGLSFLQTWTKTNKIDASGTTLTRNVHRRSLYEYDWTQEKFINKDNGNIVSLSDL